jgi:PAS domain S-box-containing protein
LTTIGRPLRFVHQQQDTRLAHGMSHLDPHDPKAPVQASGDQHNCEQVLESVCVHCLPLLGPHVISCRISGCREWSLQQASAAQAAAATESLAERVITTGLPTQLEDILVQPELIFPQGVRSALAVPVRFGSELVGAIEFFSRTKHHWSEVESLTAEAVAARCSPVLQRVWQGFGGSRRSEAADGFTMEIRREYDCGEPLVPTADENLGPEPRRGGQSLTRRLLDTLALFVGVLKPDGTLVDANAALLVAAGVQWADVAGQKFCDCYWWNYSPEIQTLVRQACATAARGETVRYDVQVQIAGGALMWIDFGVQPLFDEEGRITLLIASAVEVTNRKQIQETLERSLAQSKALINQMTEGLVVFDPEGNLIDMNRASLAIYGFQSVGMLRRHLHTFPELFELTDLTGNLVPLEAWPISRALKGEVVTGMELCVRRLDNGNQWVASYSSTPVYDGDGRILLALLTIRDVTAERRAQRGLQTSQEHLRQRVEEIERLMDVVPAAVWIAHDPQCLEITGNRRANEFYEADAGENVSASSLPEKRWFFNPEGRELSPEELPMQQAAASNQEVRDAELHVLNRSGRSFVLLGGAIPLRNEQGEVRGCLGAFMDITARKKAEQALRESERALLELTETLEQRVAERTAEVQRRAQQLRKLTVELSEVEQKERQRLATLLHDGLQQLLVATKYHVGMLRARLKESQQHRIVEQVDDLLDESLAASRKLTIDLFPPILQQGLMIDVLNWLSRWFATNHGLQVEVTCDEGCPSPDASTRSMLFQTVRELLMNVVKHAATERALLRFSCRGREQIQVEVQDHGTGFDPLQLPSHTGEGRGLGLFTIMERLNWLGGSLQIQSAPSHGTTVTVQVPLRLEAEISEGVDPLGAGTPALTARAVGVGQHEKVKVLLADDHPVMRDGLAQLLAVEPWIDVVGQAADGQQAVDLARQFQPDVILMDISMPGMDGIEATHRILSDQPGIRIIGLSMFSEESVALRMKGAGAVDYLSKTTSHESLIAAIRRCSAVPGPGLFSQVADPRALGGDPRE